MSLRAAQVCAIGLSQENTGDTASVDIHRKLAGSPRGLPALQRQELAEVNGRRVEVFDDGSHLLREYVVDVIFEHAHLAILPRRVPPRNAQDVVRMRHVIVRGVYHNRVCLIEGALLELAQRAPNFIQPLPVVSLAVDVPDRLYEELTVEDVDAVLVGFVSRLVSSHERQRLTSAGTSFEPR